MVLQFCVITVLGGFALLICMRKVPALSLSVYTFAKAVKSKGGELMKAYELLFFVAPTTSEDERTNVLSRIQNTILDVKGTVDNVDDWGKRKLAYEINGLTDGVYTLIDFHISPNQVSELNRVLRIQDAVVRHMIVARTDRD